MKSQQWKKLLAAAGLIVGGTILTAAMVDPGLPAGYWESPQATSAVIPQWPERERSLHPEACGQCHAEQFNLWKESLHAHAYSAGLVGQFPGMGDRNANDCLTCHAPLQEQRYRSAADMNNSISLRLKHAEGFNRNGHPDATPLPLRHTGVSCAACHVRSWKRFGPPPKTASGATGYQPTAVHGGFTATRGFEKSQFCASCHQFSQSMAINGKPLENTVTEWKQSTFPKRGITCQKCHMPGRRHEFRGIHDPEMVKKGLVIDLSRNRDSAILTLTSKWIGHAFPTYVTPKVIIQADALNRNGQMLQKWEWEIVREVEYNDGWKEVRDTRIMPGESRRFIATPLPAEAVKIRYRVTVIPDYFYKGVYQGLLSNRLEAKAKSHIQRASHYAGTNDYLLFDRALPL